ncbi:TPA: hypothetical protein I7682_17870 [Vibrio vulnificus]|nr:hypothetical protein [Vibrio vulnificus]
MIVARPLLPGEPDLLKGNETAKLIITNLDGQVIGCFTPSGLWTHDELESFEFGKLDPENLGWDAYLGERWIGSSEV